MGICAPTIKPIEPPDANDCAPSKVALVKKSVKKDTILFPLSIIDKEFTASTVGNFTPVPSTANEFCLLAVFSAVNPNAACFPLKVVQSVALKYPSTLVVDCGIDSVLFADKSPPPLRGAVVLIVLVVGTLLVSKCSSASSAFAPVTVESFCTCDVFNLLCCH